jgi:serine/threonine protein kinase
MAQRFLRCMRCGLPHPADLAVCPATGEPIRAAHTLDAPRPPAAPPPAPPPAVAAPSSPPPPPPAAKARSTKGPATSAGLLVGATVAGRYQVTGVIAAGGMGVVYEAVQRPLGRRVAVKCLHPKYAQDTVALARFQQEAVLVGSFGHANIIEIFDMGWLDDGTPFLVMELLEGETVSARLHREKPFRDGLAVSVARQTLAALAVTHSRGVLHRDLKPDNLFLVRREGSAPRVKVLDFGVAKAFGVGAGEGAKLTRAGYVMGTPAYMAPEQARGVADLDGRADLYAVGMILYEMLTGRLPYNARTPAALLGEIQRGALAPPRTHRPDLRPDLDALVMRCLAYDPAQRWPDAPAMQRALAALRIAETDAPATPTAEVPMDDEDTEVTAPAGLREALDELETTSQTFNVFVRPPRKG